MKIVSFGVMICCGFPWVVSITLINKSKSAPIIFNTSSWSVSAYLTFCFVLASCSETTQIGLYSFFVSPCRMVRTSFPLKKEPASSFKTLCSSCAFALPKASPKPRIAPKNLTFLFIIYLVFVVNYFFCYDLIFFT